MGEIRYADVFRGRRVLALEHIKSALRPRLSIPIYRFTVG
jgi:hypothetical protein